MRGFRALIMGSPGSGKGTHTQLLRQKYPVLTLSSGDLLRAQHNTKLPDGRTVQDILKSGELLSDDFISELMFKELDHYQNKNWILDGFPRTTHQANMLDTYLDSISLPLTIVINLDVPEKVILKRIEDRWIHAPSGRTYNYSFNPPKIHGKDDETGEPLTKRVDDNVETFKVRLHTYYEKTAPLLDYYSRHGILHSFTGNTSAEISPKIERILDGILSRHTS
ncbi:hypothetical protein HK098_000896 [Nowakowskiella sp. JEL0407]|nr:hypothetical protein HK098_000896 [Nowakowskiella sp. JEL0407]